MTLLYSPSNDSILALEHMLFMGTKTYPDENAYQAFLASHGGSSNAYTDQVSLIVSIQPNNSSFTFF